MKKTFSNPILKGFYPDPSICRVGDDYYMATSSFCYFPGIPVFHSKDLVNWEQLGHAIDRPGQIDFSKAAHSEGLWAPTIRFHEGRFYIINTYVSEGREAERCNYIVTAENPAGPWSDPIIIKGADGIDPSIFFDDDGRVWYCGNFICDPLKYVGHHGIYLCELDPVTFQFIGERKVIWDGEKSRSKYIEAPHIYKINGWYYLLVAEGGTFINHSVMFARAKEIDGEYEICPRNPVVTHRHISPVHPISVTGHGDLIETQNGEWWMVLLAVRPYGDVQFNTGRETFLIPMTWGEDGWPRVDNENGLVNESERFPNLPEHRWVIPSPNDNFESPKLGMQWNMFRSQKTDFYSLTERPGYLRLKLAPESIADDYTTPSYIARRQQHQYFGAGCAMEFVPKADGEEAGMVLVQSDEFNYMFTVKQENGKKYLTLSKHFNDAERIDNEYYENNIVKEEMKRIELPEGSDRIYLRVQNDCDTYTFVYGFTDQEYMIFADAVDARLLSTNIAGGFVGAYLGMYASANGQQSENAADFDWFEYYAQGR